jgi:hypothetical protein
MAEALNGDHLAQLHPKKTMMKMTRGKILLSRQLSKILSKFRSLTEIQNHPVEKQIEATEDANLSGLDLRRQWDVADLDDLDLDPTHGQDLLQILEVGVSPDLEAIVDLLRGSGEILDTTTEIEGTREEETITGEGDL